MNYLARSDMWEIDQALRMGQLAVPTDQSRVLARFKQIFPLALFPDDLIIEELRLVWVHREGPWADEVISIMATDIASIDASSGPLFGHIHIKSLTGGPEIFIDNLYRADVYNRSRLHRVASCNAMRYKIRCLVEGISLSARAGLKVNQEDLDNKRNFLAEAGSVKLN